MGRVNAFRPLIRRLFHLEPFDSLNVLLLARFEMEPLIEGERSVLLLYHQWLRGRVSVVTQNRPIF
jgi:hypothetical protein